MLQLKDVVSTGESYLCQLTMGACNGASGDKVEGIGIGVGEAGFDFRLDELGRVLRRPDSDADGEL
jgi:hypothetical protein